MMGDSIGKVVSGDMTGKKSVTIYDIAKEAGVSPATVSRILTGNAHVSEDKRQRVLALIKRYDFLPNAMARGLSETRSKLIGCLCCDVTNPYYARVFLECERCAMNEGYSMVLYNTMFDEKLAVALMERACEQQTDALLICGGLIDRREIPQGYRTALERVTRRMPVITAGKTVMADCHQVAVDHREGMRLAVEHAASLGHTRIAAILYPDKVGICWDKKQGYHDAMDALGLPSEPAYMIQMEGTDQEIGYRGMQELIGHNPRPTAVICMNELTAIGALQALMELGLRVPQDVSLIAFDNTLLSDITVPRLTTVGYPFDEYGRLLIQTAAEAVEKQSPPSVRLLQPRLVVKASCHAFAEEDAVESAVHA